MPNQYVRVRVKGAIRPNAILVPQRAIQQSSKGHIVWVVKESKAEARPSRSELGRQRMVRLRGAEGGRAGGRRRGPTPEPRHARDGSRPSRSPPKNQPRR